MNVKLVQWDKIEGEATAESQDPAWVPTFLADLNRSLIIDQTGRSIAIKYGFKPPRLVGNSYHLQYLSETAGRWRLASLNQGFEFRKGSCLMDEFTDPSLGFELGYSGFLKIAFAHNAFETFCRMFEISKWYKQHGRVFEGVSWPEDLSQWFNAAFNEKTVHDVFDNRLNPHDLKERLKAFSDGDTKETYAVCVGIRHLLFHGKLPSFSQHALPEELSDNVVKCVLGGIKNFCRKIESETGYTWF